jgi:signal peptidase II
MASVTRSTDDAEAPSVASPARRPRRIGLFVAVAVTALALDVVSKVLVAAKLGDGQQVRILGGAIYLDEARNSGAAFSLGTGFTIVLTAIAIVVVAVIIRTASRMRSTAWAVALGLVLGGALGNLGDRIFRAPGVGRGHVVDWISLFGPMGEHWPIFNLADSAIVCGAILAALVSMFGIDLDGTRAGSKHDRA